MCHNSRVRASICSRFTALACPTVIGILWATGCGSGAESDPIGSDATGTLGSTVVSDDTSIETEWLDPADLTYASATLSFSASPVFCCNPLSIEFAAELSGDSGSRATTFEWDFDDGRSATGDIVEHTYPWFAEYTIVLTARRSDGVTETVQQTLSLMLDDTGHTEVVVVPVSSSEEPDVTVPPQGNEPDETPPVSLGPVAEAGADQSVAAGAEVLLDGSASEHPGGATLAYSWRQVTGPDVTLSTPDAATTTFVAPAPALSAQTLTFELTVTANGLSAEDTVGVEVLPLPGGGDGGYGVHLAFLSGPKGDTTPGEYEVSWHFLSDTLMSNVYLSRDCCECQNVDSAVLTPDGNGVYTTTVEIPDDRTAWYFVRYTHGGVEYSSRSVHVNTPPGDPTAPPPMVIWFHKWRYDPSILADALASGVVTHVMIHGGDRRGNHYQEPLVTEAIAMCQAAGVKTIWSLNLWNHFTDLPSLDDTVAPDYYVAAMEQVAAEATIIGADYTAMDCEAYAGVPFDALFDTVLSQERFDSMSSAIDMASQQMQVDFVYPSGMPFVPLWVNNTFRPLGRIRISKSGTYYDNAQTLCRIDYPFDVFGAYVTPVTERPYLPDYPFFLVHDIVLRRYLWSQVDGAPDAVNGLYLYTGANEEVARGAARMLYHYFGSH